MPSQRDRFIAACNELIAVAQEIGADGISAYPSGRVFLGLDMHAAPAEAWDTFMRNRVADKAWSEWSYT